MKTFLVLAVLAVVFLTGCSRNVVPESELAKLSPQKVLNLGAERYAAYDYDGAVYYYEAVEKNFTQPTDEQLNARAWARYEIGFIRNQQGRKAEAVKSFEQVLAMQNPSAAPKILARQMLDRIRSKK